MRLAYLVLLLIGLISSSLISNTLDLKVQRFNSQDGLPTSPMAGKFVKDSNGFIWFGTWTGLYKYDGYSFQGYYHDPQDSTSLTNDWCIAYIDRQGTLWAGTRGGLDRFDPVREKFTHYKHDPDDTTSVSHGDITVLFEDSQGRFWIGTEHGLNIFDRQTGKFKRFFYDPENDSSIRGNRVRTISEDQKGRIWIGCGNPFAAPNKGALNLYQSESATFRHFLPFPADRSSRKNYIQALYSTDDGNLWVSGWEGGLYLFDTETERFTTLPYLRYPSANNRENFHGIVAFARQPGTDYLWMAVFGGGLNRYNMKTFASDYYLFDSNDPFSISDNRLWEIFFDEFGLLWVGTHVGLNKIDVAGKFHFYSPAIQDDEWVTDILDEKDHVLWLATSKMRLIYWDRKNNISSIFIPPAIKNKWNVPGAALAAGDNGKLWFASDQGLYTFNKKTKTFSLYNHPLNDTTLFCDQPLRMVKDDYGKLWFGSEPLMCADLINNKIFIYRNKQGDPGSLINDDVDALFKDKEGQIWVGTSAGMVRYNRDTNNFTRMIDIREGQKAAITGIVQDRKGHLWTATDTYGIIELDPQSGTYQKNDIRKGIHTNTFYNIVMDTLGYAWAFAASGASRFDPEKNTTRFFDQTDGLVEMQFNRRAVRLAASGEIVLGGRGGINIINPDDYLVNTSPPAVIISGIRIYGEPVQDIHSLELQKPVSFIKELLLNHDQNDLTFEFIAIDYFNAGMNRYKYLLENYDAQWIDGGSLRNARYTNLNPGEYTLKIIAANSNGTWNEQGAQLSITILKPWWVSWWAYTLYAILGLGLLYFVRRYEMNRLDLRNRLRLEKVESDKFKELDQMKSRFFANISHEFRTPLTLVLGQIQAVLNEKIAAQMQKKLTIAMRNAKRLLQLVSELLDLSKLESGNLTLHLVRADIISFLKNLLPAFESLAREKNITLNFSSSEEQIMMDFDPDKLEMIINNLLSNALKFTPQNGEIKADIHMDKQGEQNESCVLRVSDTGIGINADKLENIFNRFYQVEDSDSRKYEGSGIGLALVRELVDLFHGDIDVQSTAGKGSCFTVCLPLRQQDLDVQRVAGADWVSPSQTHEIPDHSVETQAEGDNNNPLILIVEDNADLRSYISDTLRDTYNVLQAADGRQGLKLACERIPDLIISDVMMPHMNGYQFSSEIRSDERTSHIPIIMLTAKAADKDRITGLETGVDDYLVKPFNQEELLVRIKNLIRLRRELHEKFATATVIKPNDISGPSVDQQFLKKVLGLIEEHMSEELFSVPDLAGAVHMSEAQLNRKLNALIGQPPGQLLRCMRLQRAADLIKSGQGNIAEICFSVGFSDQANFTRSFKKQFGVSPSIYKSVDS